MARISLRAYNGEIEAMIDRNDIDGAIVNCRSILERFPKHVDTYRLMGKALLEAQHFGDAADVFHRVLSSVPDDFIAHLGMSIIREEEGNLDGAIWHMERSFEVQPSNAAIQVELRRLYGQRDGLAPQKIQLTRGALARMSAKSNLYSQAISELRTALSEDPQRPDLQVVLATMYAQTGAKMEAIETCNTLLSKLPYCLEANRILAELLPETERAELAQEYKDRLIELDPYYAHISAVTDAVDQVPDRAVTIEQQGFAPEYGDSQPFEGSDWISSLGISMKDEISSEDKSPEWFSTEEEIPEIEENEAVVPNEEEMMIEKEPESTSPKPTEQEDLPDWMSEAGWEEIRDDSEAGEEETPVWLRAVMESPDEDQISASNEDEVSEASEVTDEKLAEVDEAGFSGTLLGGAVAGATVGAILESDEDGEEKEPHEGQTDFSAEEDLILDGKPEGIPEGEGSEELEEDSETIIGEAVVSATALDEIIAEKDDSLPEKLESSGEELEEVPDWLQDLGEGIPEEGVQVEEDIPEDEFQVEESSQEVPESLPEIEEQFATEIIQAVDGESVEPEETPDNLPEWLSSVSPAKSPDAELSELVEAGGEPEIVLARIPAWLKQMEQEHLAQMAKESESIEDLDVLQFDSEITELTGEDVPSWLMDAMEPEMSSDAEVIETIESIDEVFQQPTVEDLQAVEAQEIDSITSEPLIEEEMISAEAEQIVEEPSIESDTHPVVSTQPSDVEPEEALSEAEIVPDLVEENLPQQPEEFEEQPVSLEESVGAPTIPEDSTLTEEDAAMAWLESLAQKQGVSEDELLTSPEERPDEPPDWIQELVPEEDSGEKDTQGIQEGFAAAAIAGLAIGKHFDEDEEESLTPDSAEMVTEDEPSEWISDYEEPEEEVSTAGLTETKTEPELDEQELLEADVGAESAVSRDQLTEESGPDIDLTEMPEGQEEAVLAAAETSEWMPNLEEGQVEAIEPEMMEAPAAPEVETVAEEMVEEDDHIEVKDIAKAAAAGAIIEEALTEDDSQAPEEGLPEEVEQEVAEVEALEKVSEVEEPEVDMLVSEDLMGAQELIGDDVDDEIEAELVSTMEESPVEEPMAEEWYQDLEAEGISGETPSDEWTPAILTEEEPSDDTQEIRVDKRLDLNAASLSQLERIPRIGFIHAQRIVNYRETSGPFKNFEQLGKVPGITSEILEDLKEYLTVEVVPEAVPPPTTQPELQGAWQSVSAGEIETAIEQYNQFINNDEHLDEVIRDLQEAIVKFPTDVSLYQTLGDAYLHANLLQEALDAYNRAEDLIS